MCFAQCLFSFGDSCAFQPLSLQQYNAKQRKPDALFCENLQGALLKRASTVTRRLLLGGNKTRSAYPPHNYNARQETQKLQRQNLQLAPTLASLLGSSRANALYLGTQSHRCGLHPAANPQIKLFLHCTSTATHVVEQK